MKQISIIGTSEIAKEHIKTILANKTKIYSISSTRKNSKKLNYFKKKFKIQKIFKSWKECIQETSRKKNCFLLIASRTIDTFKIINYANKYKLKIFVEKPLSVNIQHFDKLKKNKNNIFVGYNRLFYNNVIYLKKKLKKVDNVLVKCPEISSRDIVLNSTHIISIILYLFGKIKIFSKIRNNNSIMVLAKNSKNVPICFVFPLKSTNNFSIEINEGNTKFLLEPVEILKIFKNFKVKYMKNRKKLKVVNPILKKETNEFFFDNYKPGFYNQFWYFKNIFFKLDNEKKLNNLKFAKEVVKTCNDILKQ